MRGGIGIRWFLAPAIVFAVASAGSPAGTIVTTGATIQAGAGSPQGVVTIDACAPPADPPPRPPLGSLTAPGSFEGSLPPKPSTGSGTLGDITIDSTVSLPGGTYECVNYAITGGVTVTYLGEVTILATGSVEIEGTLEGGDPRKFEDSGPITIVAGDEIVVYSLHGLPLTGIYSQDSDAPIRLEADRVEIGVTERVPEDGVVAAQFVSRVESEFSDIIIRAHGLPPSSSGVEIQDTRVIERNERLTIQSADFVSIGLFEAGADTVGFGEIVCQAFGGFLRLDGGRCTAVEGRGLLQSQDDLTLRNGADLAAQDGELLVESLGGDVVLETGGEVFASGRATGTGEIVVAASGSVLLSGSSNIESDGTGGVRVTAHSEDVRLEAPGGNGASQVTCRGTGAGLVEAAGDVELFDASGFDSRDGLLNIRAHGGTVRLDGTPSVSSLDAAVDVRAAGGIVAALGPSVPEPAFSGETVQLVAGVDGIGVVGDVAAESGFLAMHAEGTIALDGTFTSSGGQPVTLLSETGSILVPDAVVRGGAGTADESGDVLLESFGESAATIDATGATIVSEDVGGESGDVSLLIHGGDVIEAFMLPKVVKVKVNERRPERSKVSVTGFLDTGPDPVDLLLPASLTFWEDGSPTTDDFTFPVALQPRGPRRFVHDEGGVSFQVKAPKSDSSRTNFRLVVETDLMSRQPQDGQLSVRFANATLDARATILVENGKYKLSRIRGRQSQPDVFPYKLKQVHRGPGEDTFDLLAGIATEGGTPPSAPDILVSLRDGFAFTVPGDQFTRRRDGYFAKNPSAAPNVDLIQIDFLKEQLRVKAKNLDLGPIGGARPVTIEIGLDGDVRAVAVRIAPKGAKTLKY